MSPKVILSCLASGGIFILLTGCGKQTNSEQIKEFSDDTKAVVSVELDGEPVAFIFVSKDGDTMPQKPDECEQHEECMTLINKLHDAHQQSLLRLSSTQDCGDQPHASQPKPDQPIWYLPHRPLHEIDVQNNATPRPVIRDQTLCPTGTIVYEVNVSGQHFLECMALVAIGNNDGLTQ